MSTGRIEIIKECVALFSLLLLEERMERIFPFNKPSHCQSVCVCVCVCVSFHKPSHCQREEGIPVCVCVCVCVWMSCVVVCVSVSLNVSVCLCMCVCLCVRALMCVRL